MKNHPLVKLLLRILPHAAAVLIFFVLISFYFLPAFQGKVLVQNDIRQYLGMSHEVVEFENKTGEHSMWTNAMFSGMPTYQITGVDAKNNYSYYVASPLRGLNLPYIVYIVLAGAICFYIMLQSFKINPWISIICTIAFSFSSFNIISLEAGHETKILALAFFPLVIAGLRYCFDGRYLLGATLTAAGMGLNIQANHLQISYYLFMLLIIWAIFELVLQIRKGTVKTFILGGIIACVAAGAGIMTNSTNLLLTEEYSKETTRGGSELTPLPSDNPGAAQATTDKKGGLNKEYALNWSNGRFEPFTILIPNLYGGSSTGSLSTSSETYKVLKGQMPNAKEVIKQLPLYWGPQPFTSGPIYFGAIIVFLFVVGIIVVKGPQKWWLVVGAALAILLSMGKNLMFLTDIFFNYVPMYNKFRSVTMIMVVAQVCFPLMGALALQKILEHKDNLTKKNLLTAGYIIGGILLFFAVLGGAFFSFSGENDAQLPEALREPLEKDRAQLLLMDSLRGLLFVGLAFGLLYAYVINKIKKPLVIGLLAFLVLADLWMVDKRFLNNDNFETKRNYENQFAQSPADQVILQDKDINFRVLNTAVSFANDASTSYWHKSIGGYHGAKLRRYQDLIERHIAQNNVRVINMLNTRYIIARDQQSNTVVAQRNPGALGNAWFIDKYYLVNSADAESDSLNTIDVANTVVVDQKFGDYLNGFQPKKDSLGTIVNTVCEPNYLKYEYNASSEQLVVFSEVYYKEGWKATIDGQPVDHIRANYLLRAMRVPAGKHIIEFNFDPDTYHVGEKLSLAGSVVLWLLIIASLGTGIYHAIKRYRADSQNIAE